MLDTATAPRQQIVTSSDLVRHFGYWQDCAARAPVYVLHRGRPRLVLTSVDIMDALCAPHLAAPPLPAPDTDDDRGAIDAALFAAGAVAAAWIDAKGFLETGARALAILCEQSVVSLADIAFVSLFDAASHAGVEQAIEHVILTGNTAQINALLLARRETPLAVRIGLAPRRHGLAITGVMAVLTADIAG